LFRLTIGREILEQYCGPILAPEQRSCSMARKIRSRSKCHIGGHRAAKERHMSADVTWSTCIDCGCDIFRTLKDRRWVFSGLLGSPVQTPVRPARPAADHGRSAGMF